MPVPGTYSNPVVVSFSTDSVQGSATQLTPKFAKANVAQSQTDSTVITAVTAKKIRVLALVAQAGATATDITFQSNATAKTVLFGNAANTPLVLPFNPVGWFETVAGEALKVTTGAGSSTGVQLVYLEV